MSLDRKILMKHNVHTKLDNIKTELSKTHKTLKDLFTIVLTNQGDRMITKKVYVKNTMSGPTDKLPNNRPKRVSRKS